MDFLMVLFLLFAVPAVSGTIVFYLGSRGETKNKKTNAPRSSKKPPAWQGLEVSAENTKPNSSVLPSSKKAPAPLKLNPLKVVEAAQIADEVSSAADIDSVIQFASILSSEKEVMQAVQEANEELRDAYETKVKDLFEKRGIDRESLTAKAIESELNRCMKLGLNKICLDERLVPILGSQEIGKQESTKIEKSGSWSELKDQL